MKPATPRSSFPVPRATAGYKVVKGFLVLGSFLVLACLVPLLYVSTPAVLRSPWLAVPLYAALFSLYSLLDKLGPFHVAVAVDATRVVFVRLTWFTAHLREVILDETPRGWWDYDRWSLYGSLKVTYHAGTGGSYSVVFERRWRSGADDLVARFGTQPPELDLAGPSAFE